MAIEIRVPSADELRRFLETGATAFAQALDPEEAERDERLLEPERLLAAYDGDLMVGTAGDFDLTLTIPGGELKAAGLTLAGVLPTHRRRGVLTQLMRKHLDAAVARGEPLGILWSSEEAIYERFGYGIATLRASIRADRDRLRFRGDPPSTGRVRLVSEEETPIVLPPIYERVRRRTPGMFARTDEWWRSLRLPDPERRRYGAGPAFSAVLALDGADEGYARYRVKQDWENFVTTSVLRVLEVVAATPLATRELWRYLVGVDLVARVDAWQLPVDSPLFLLVTEPRRLRIQIGDALWLRILDLERALSARSYALDGELALDLSDGFRPENEGVWRLEVADGRARMKRAPERGADLRLDVADLASAYLGGFTFAQLAEAGRVEELEDAAVERADSLFRTPAAPWCPEIF